MVLTPNVAFNSISLSAFHNKMENQFSAFSTLSYVALLTYLLQQSLVLQSVHVFTNTERKSIEVVYFLYFLNF